MNGTPVCILIADDHEMVRKGLRAILEPDPELRIVGEAVNGVEAVNLARIYTPDVILMDLMMPVMDGLKATEQIKKELPGVEILALTFVLDNSLIEKAVQAGAIGYLLKSTDAPQLCSAIKAASRGQVQLAPEAAAMLLHKIKVPHSTENLTARETEVLQLMAQGLSNKEMAGKLFVSEATVKTHVQNILQKLQVSSRTQAALFAVRAGMVLVSAMGQI